MKSIKSLIIALLTIVPLLAFSQGDDKAEKIAIKVMPLESNIVESNAAATLYNRLNQAVALNGLGSTSKSNKFLLVPSVTLVDSQKSATIPPQYIVEVEINVFFVDNDKQLLMAQESVTKKGVGETEQKAIKKAVTSLAARDPKLKKVIAVGKERIMDYYNEECEAVLQKIQKYIEMDMMEEAINELYAIPRLSENAGCYDNSLDILGSIAKDKLKAAEKELQKDPDVSWIND